MMNESAVARGRLGKRCARSGVGAGSAAVRLRTASDKVAGDALEGEALTHRRLHSRVRQAADDLLRQRAFVLPII